MDPRSSGEPPGPTTYPPSELLVDPWGVHSEISSHRGPHVVSGEGRYAVVNETRGQAGQRVPWIVELPAVVDETRGKHVFRAAWVSCCEKHHLCSLSRGIYLHAFPMQSAILPSLLEAQIDSPAPSARHSPHMPGFGLAWEQDSGYSGSFESVRDSPHVGFRARPGTRLRIQRILHGGAAVLPT